MAYKAKSDMIVIPGGRDLYHRAVQNRVSWSTAGPIWEFLFFFFWLEPFFFLFLFFSRDFIFIPCLPISMCPRAERRTLEFGPANPRPSNQKICRRRRTVRVAVGPARPVSYGVAFNKFIVFRHGRSVHFMIMIMMIHHISAQK
jgi:hypothetical protein